MTASETPVSLADKLRLAVMSSGHVAEMAAYAPDAAASRPYPYFDLYWSEADRRFPSWLRVDGAEAGFALIRHLPETGRTQMAEFFVAPPFRLRALALPRRGG